MFADQYTKLVFVDLLKAESEALASLKKFVLSVGTPKKLRQDNAKEFLSEQFKTYCLDAGIRQEETITETPQQNGLAERCNRTLLVKMFAHWLRTSQDDVGSSNFSHNKDQELGFETRRRKMHSRADAMYKT